MARMIRVVPQLMRNIWPIILSSRRCSVLLHSLCAQKMVYGFIVIHPIMGNPDNGSRNPILNGLTFSEYHSISWYIIQLSLIVGSISHEISQFSYPHHSPSFRNHDVFSGWIMDHVQLSAAAFHW